jgi:hypothetical protein
MQTPQSKVESSFTKGTISGLSMNKEENKLLFSREMLHIHKKFVPLI